MKNLISNIVKWFENWKENRFQNEIILHVQMKGDLDNRRITTVRKKIKDLPKDEQEMLRDLKEEK